VLLLLPPPAKRAVITGSGVRAPTRSVCPRRMIGVELIGGDACR
jgi:hypothetical protein